MNKQTHNKIKALTEELSNLLTSFKFAEVWTVAGALNATLKTATDEDSVVVEAKRELRNYYHISSEISTLNKRLVGKGHRLAEIASKL
ncbi:MULTISPECIES: hypothetical protein [unclassified Enterococcus]|uniref:hypothetical protein n=1 Tax=unclassified Enterococcus TaxID=2608891 RepID=UPI001551A5D6|nr:MULTISPECIES: hypothetical protein [unclassified Enterococcus]MBS7576958.1 hypothetical protein [Enterococcus sp. MMGLQ5-2]MBS7584365.1 hypothetical protein [Enterococcus sp. MMGLQ5-1]NPD12220.1 hypothetical protein [Enterococcus sp. MMGLQ5-1]NPD36792.1 hypothetical protein [Enterococcus sp. MMGLQ5-2]